MMTGALIAVAVQRPILAIPLALLSHFIADMMPHYGAGDVSFNKRDSQKHFILQQAIDAYLAVGLMWLIPFALQKYQAPSVTAWCMLAAFLPDVIWPYQYVMAKRRGTYPPLNWYTRFHKAIQWCERPWGAYVEFGWLLAVAGSIAILSR